MEIVVVVVGCGGGVRAVADAARVATVAAFAAAECHAAASCCAMPRVAGFYVRFTVCFYRPSSVSGHFKVIPYKPCNAMLCNSISPCGAALSKDSSIEFKIGCCDLWYNQQSTKQANHNQVNLGTMNNFW